tara:strand:- start:1494 stop:1673 length:180 start_codon:yes stop_codon:yes gene_type:complete
MITDMKPNQKSTDYTHVPPSADSVKGHKGIKYGKVKTFDKKMSTYEKAMDGTKPPKTLK